MYLGVPGIEYQNLSSVSLRVHKPYPRKVRRRRAADVRTSSIDCARSIMITAALTFRRPRLYWFVNVMFVARNLSDVTFPLNFILV